VGGRVIPVVSGISDPGPKIYRLEEQCKIFFETGADSTFWKTICASLINVNWPAGTNGSSLPKGLPDFSGCDIPKWGKIYIETGKNIPNGHKIYQMAIKYTKWP
jgi:hypothetical protein